MKAIPMPNGGYRIMPTREERFWSKVEVRGPRDCWSWRGYTMPDGYGMFRDGTSMRTSSQVALELSGKPRPEAPYNHALHSDHCVTRACCNPSHLRWGSNEDNVADRERLGRNIVKVGEEHGSSKLSEKDVLAIRQAQGRQKDIAKKFGVCQRTVSLIKRRETWGHLP